MAWRIRSWSQASSIACVALAAFLHLMICTSFKHPVMPTCAQVMAQVAQEASSGERWHQCAAWSCSADRANLLPQSCTQQMREASIMLARHASEPCTLETFAYPCHASLAHAQGLDYTQIPTIMRTGSCFLDSYRPSAPTAGSGVLCNGADDAACVEPCREGYAKAASGACQQTCPPGYGLSQACSATSTCVHEAASCPRVTAEVPFACAAPGALLGACLHAGLQK